MKSIAAHAIFPQSLLDERPESSRRSGIKSGALVLVLGGDCAQVIGLLTGARRYYKHLNLF